MNNTSPFTLRLGDCLESMRGMADNSVDAVVCDPPYGLSDHTEKDIRACMAAWLSGDEYLHSKKGFMGKTWDSFVPGPEVWREVFRVLKPGGYVLAFASTRTDDLMSMAMRLAGFRKHPFVGWVTGSGFPKAASLSKAFDRGAGVVREKLLTPTKKGNNQDQAGLIALGATGMTDISTPVTQSAKQWDGWAYGLQSLKPAIEPCLMFQKPHEGRMTDNVLQWGTGAVNIDATRIATDDKMSGGIKDTESWAGNNWGANPQANIGKWEQPAQGRWPANLILENCPEVVAGFPVTGAAKPARSGIKGGKSLHEGGHHPDVIGHWPADAGGSAARFFKQVTPEAEDLEAARFFYCAKASKKDRNEGLDHLPVRRGGAETFDKSNRDGLGEARQPMNANTHMCVKPTDLMAYLCRLVTPPGGTVLDPFMGSGSTGKAAIREGFNFIGCEMDPEYLEIARARIQHELNKIEAARAPVVTSAPVPQLDLFTA